MMLLPSTDGLHEDEQMPQILEGPSSFPRYFLSFSLLNFFLVYV